MSKLKQPLLTAGLLMPAFAFADSGSMTAIPVIQIISVIAFIIFINAISLQSRAKLILSVIYIVTLLTSYFALTSYRISRHLPNIAFVHYLIAALPVLAVAFGYIYLSRNTIERNRTTQRK